MHLTRPIERVGAHAKGFNAHSIGICYEGSLDCRGRPADIRTPAQAGHAPATRRATTGEIPRLPGMRTPGSFTGLEQKR